MEETILKQIPLGRFGTVEDVRERDRFRASDERATSPVRCWVVDGGG